MSATKLMIPDVLRKWFAINTVNMFLSTTGNILAATMTAQLEQNKVAALAEDSI